jgi:hypothetical protein
MMVVFKDSEIELLYPLRRALFDEYGPADKRTKKLEKAITFRVDGAEMYRAAGGQPLSHVCSMYVHVENEKKLILNLSGNVPIEGPVIDWLKSERLQKPSGRLSISLEPGNQEKLTRLATAMLAIVEPGRRYFTPSFKYTCPRVADALTRLERLLDKVWK